MDIHPMAGSIHGQHDQFYPCLQKPFGYNNEYRYCPHRVRVRYAVLPVARFFNTGRVKPSNVKDFLHLKKMNPAFMKRAKQAVSPLLVSIRANKQIGIELALFRYMNARLRDFGAKLREIRPMNEAVKPDIIKIRADFPILDIDVCRKPLVYLDNGATTQKALVRNYNALEAWLSGIQQQCAPRRAFSARTATDAQEAARRKVAQFISAKRGHEIIFTGGTTENINLVAYSFGKKDIYSLATRSLFSLRSVTPMLYPRQPDDLAEDRGATLKVILWIATAI